MILVYHSLSWVSSGARFKNQLDLCGFADGAAPAPAGGGFVIAKTRVALILKCADNIKSLPEYLLDLIFIG